MGCGCRRDSERRRIEIVRKGVKTPDQNSIQFNLILICRRTKSTRARSHIQTLTLDLLRIIKQLSRKMQYCYIRIVCKNYRYLLFFMIYIFVLFRFVHVFTSFWYFSVCVRVFLRCFFLLYRHTVSSDLRTSFLVSYRINKIFFLCFVFGGICIRIHFIYCVAAYFLFFCRECKYSTRSPPPPPSPAPFLISSVPFS